MTDDEKDRALCEAHCNSAADEYFNARPQLDSDVNRRIFYAGHRKAWIERGEAVRLNATVPDGWVLIATDAYEAGYGKWLQAAQTGKEIENPWGDEPGREAWSIGYALAKERALAAPQPAQQDDDEGDALTIAYLHGHGKGKDSVQPVLSEKDALLRQALDALEGFVQITNDSQGVAGYHLSGDTAEWDEFDEVDAASNTIEAIRAHLGVKND